MRNSAFLLSLSLIFIIPLEGVVQLPGLGTGATAIGLAVSAYWLATVVITGRLSKPGPFQLVFFLFVIWNALSVFWSEDPNRTVAHVVTWVQLLLLVFIFWDLYRTRAALLAGLQAYVLGAYVAVGSAGANFFAGNVFYTRYQRYSPGDTNPDGFGFILALGIPVAWYLAGTKRATKMNGLLKLVNYAYIPAAFLGLSLAGTRTALIASVVGMGFGLASLTRLRLGARVAIFLLLSAAILILLPHVQTLTSFQRFDTTASALAEGDLNQRPSIWSDGFASFLEHPLLGVGSNMYRSVNSLGKVAHNSFLSVLVEVGMIGFALFGTILTMAVIRAWGQPKWDASFWLTMLMVWAIGASTLTWEYRRSTWLFLSLLIVSAAITSRRHEAITLIKGEKRVGQLVPQVNLHKLPPGTENSPLAGRVR
jgi:O-antigen ligase